MVVNSMDIQIINSAGRKFIISYQDDQWKLVGFRSAEDELPQFISVTVGFPIPRGHVTLQYIDKSIADPEFPWMLLKQILDGRFNGLRVEDQNIAQQALHDFFQKVAIKLDATVKHSPSDKQREFDIDNPLGTLTQT